MITTTYDYKILHSPTEADINLWGAQGYRLHKMQLDPRDGELAYVVMEWTQEPQSLGATVTLPPLDEAQREARRGRK